MLFPLNRVFDTDDWMEGFQEFWDFDRDKIRFWLAFNKEIVKRFEQYQVPRYGRRLPAVVPYKQFFAVSVEAIGCHEGCLQHIGSAIKISRLRVCSHDLKARSPNSPLQQYVCSNIWSFPTGG